MAPAPVCGVISLKSLSAMMGRLNRDAAVNQSLLGVA